MDAASAGRTPGRSSTMKLPLTRRGTEAVARPAAPASVEATTNRARAYGATRDLRLISGPRARGRTGRETLYPARPPDRGSADAQRNPRSAPTIHNAAAATPRRAADASRTIGRARTSAAGRAGRRSFGPDD